MPFDSFVKDRGLHVVLEPVLSIKQKAAVGCEARLRGPSGDPGNARAQAARDGIAVDLDRWYRREALAAYQAAGAPGLLLLGFETAVLDMGVAGSGHLGSLVRDLSLDPANIVIAIRESKVDDLAALKDFVNRHRAQGFLIALRDLGEGHSNLERVVLTRPDMLKIGPRLVEGLEREFFAQEILKSLGSLSKKIGALLVAEGVETEAQALAALDHGVDMLQGPFFNLVGTEVPLDALAARHKSVTIEKTKSAQRRGRDLDSLLSLGLRLLSGKSPSDFDAALTQLIEQNAGVECVFVLNESGIQESETHARPGVAFKRNALFHPARRGADHSMKDYVYLLIDAFVNRFRTEPYVSQASGNLCVTLSGTFRDNANNTHILCMDVP